MWRQLTSIVVVILLINFTSGQERWFKSRGFANMNCPLDDDPDDPTVLPFVGDCSKFIKCSYGFGYIMSCPRGLKWSNILARCESPKVANCDDLATTTRPSIGSGCTYMFRSNPNDCSKAYQCINGQDMEIECPAGSLWDKSLNKCSFNNVVC